MELVLTRDIFTDSSTVGSLFLKDQFQCYTLEDRQREIPGVPVGEWKVPKETAIPHGRYEVKLLLSPRFGFVTPHLIDVPGFTEIEMHPGNTNKDTEGCILVGTQREVDVVTNSRIAFTALMAKLMVSTESIFITI